MGGGRQNVIGRYPSKKMGVIIQFENHRVELARIYELEHDPEVLEYFATHQGSGRKHVEASGFAIVLDETDLRGRSAPPEYRANRP